MTALALTILLLVAGSARAGFEFSVGEPISFRNVSGGDAQLPIVEQNGQGLCAIDFDGDGLLDLYLVNGSTTERWRKETGPGGALFRNRGDRSFTEVAAGVPGPAWGTGCAVGDFDGDGRSDLFVAGFDTSRLYHNRGDGTFEDVTRRSRVELEGWASSAAWADFDGDGRLDLAVSRYVVLDLDRVPAAGPNREPCEYKGVATGCPPIFHSPLSTRLFLQEGDGTFRDASAEASLAAAETRGFGIVALPLFGSGGLPDLYVACDQMPNRLFRNRSSKLGPRLEESALALGAARSAEGKPESGMGLSVGDVWEDGRPDLFLTNFAGEKNTLYRNLGETFVDASAGSGLEGNRNELGWGNALADFDADSHLDAMVANGHIYPQVRELADPADVYEQPIRLYAGEGKGRFREVAVGAFTERRSRRGLVVADLDDDGRLDVVTQTHRGVPQVFWNRSGAGHHWIRFRPEGVGPGTKVTITLPDGSRRASWSMPNQGYQSSQDPRIFFGLGSGGASVAATVVWPDGANEALPALEADRDYVIRPRRAPQPLAALRRATAAIRAGGRAGCR